MLNKNVKKYNNSFFNYFKDIYQSKLHCLTDETQIYYTSINNIISQLNKKTMNKTFGYIIPSDSCFKSIHKTTNTLELIQFLNILQRHNIIFKYELINNELQCYNSNHYYDFFDFEYNTKNIQNALYYKAYYYTDKFKDGWRREVFFSYHYRRLFVWLRFLIRRYRRYIRQFNNNKDIKKNSTIYKHFGFSILFYYFVHLNFFLVTKNIYDKLELKDQHRTFWPLFYLTFLGENYSYLRYDRLSKLYWRDIGNNNMLQLKYIIRIINALCIKAETKLQKLWTPVTDFYSKYYLLWEDSIRNLQKKKRFDYKNKLNFLVNKHNTRLNYIFLYIQMLLRNQCKRNLTLSYNDFSYKYYLLKNLSYKNKVFLYNKALINHYLKFIYSYNLGLLSRMVKEINYLNNKYKNETNYLNHANSKVFNYKLLKLCYNNLMKFKNKTDGVLQSFFKINKLLDLIFFINKSLLVSGVRFKSLENNSIKNLKDKYLKLYDSIYYTSKDKFINKLIKNTYKKNLYVYIYPNTLIKRKIIRISTNTKPVFFVYKTLLKLKRLQSYKHILYIFRTSRGIMTLNEVVKNRIGGELIVTIIY